MSSADGKKKLRVLTRESKTVMPEILPDPTTARRMFGGPRQRTLVHMQLLLAGAAAMSASVACGKEPARVTAPVTPDDGGTTTASRDVDSGAETTPTSTATGTVSAQPRPPLTPTGYAVVDPMPPPAHCPGIAQLVKSTASFVVKDGMTLAVVRFPMPAGRPDYKYVKDAKPVAYGVTVVKTEVKADGVTVSVKIDPAKTASFSVGVKGTCNQGPGTLTAHVSWGAPPDPSITPNVSVSEY